MGDRNVLGGELEPCGTDPLTGFYRDGCCTTGPEDLGSHTICAVVTAEFLEHQRRIGNDLSTPMPQFRFPGLVPGDRWCVTAANWLQAHRDGAAAPVVLASTHQRALEIVPLDILKPYSVDVPADAWRPSRNSSAPPRRNRSRRQHRTQDGLLFEQHQPQPVADQAAVPQRGRGRRQRLRLGERGRVNARARCRITFTSRP